ncbi:MAG: hypothetical protein LC744_07490 [Chloroflexi bacterium]|nr:hypothetical protein [Chloroflexota bacterium]
MSWIGDGAMFVGRHDDMPYAGMVLVPIDVADERQRLGQLATFGQLAAADPIAGLSVSRAHV